MLQNDEAVGRWREIEANRMVVDASGKRPTGEQFDGPSELKMILGDGQDKLTRVVVEKTLIYAPRVSHLGIEELFGSEFGIYLANLILPFAGELKLEVVSERFPGAGATCNRHVEFQNQSLPKGCSTLAKDGCSGE